MTFNRETQEINILINMIKYIHIVLAIWIYAVVAIFAEDFPNRPTASNMDEKVVFGRNRGQT